MHRFGLLALTSLALLATACSANIDDLFGGSGNTDGNGGSGGVGVNASSSGGQAQSTATGATNGSTTTTTSTTTTGETSSTTTTGETSSTTTTTGQTTATTSGTTGNTVDCDNTTCSVDDGDVCCWTDALEDATCTGASSCNGIGKTAVGCQFPSQCPGQICCAHRAFPQGSEYGYTACQDSCDYPDLYLCDSTSPACPTYQGQNGNTIQSFCKPSTLLPPGYTVCGFN